MTPVDTEAEARAFVDELRAEFPAASHHCSAWRIASPAIDRCSDDGEPSGSAGRPILSQLTGRDLVNVAVVVIRHFGGTKLGVGGLVRAYGAAAAAVLDRADLIEYSPTVTIIAVAGYDDAERVQRAVTDLGATVTGTDYGSRVTLTLTSPVGRLDEILTAIAGASAGRAEITDVPEG